ncbi:YHS domain protein [Rosistilla ulvae]|uniref:YHS domain protein n=1 Tax=Rosistilla ulvae TaxID=1930277 RepID=A0A517LU61_9BACT|nr:hypothetical protein [Rosistilla ulvae]QDS86146.1 YHS domain protein [Rosistilla ulvae]
MLHQRPRLRSLLTATTLSTCLIIAPQADAQSGTRAPRPTPPAASGGSQSRAAQPPAGGSQSRMAQAKIAMDGYCPVCVIDMKKWVRGTTQFQANYDGKTYLFPGEEQKQVFLADPAKYVPALGGDCTVCSVNMSQRMPGTVQHSALYGGRLFLFPGEEQKAAFRADPKKYANIDLAMNGLCSVCRVEMQQDVPGKPEIATVHQGLRYLFPSDDQRKMFLANPAKYAVPNNAPLN